MQVLQRLEELNIRVISEVSIGHHPKHQQHQQPPCISASRPCWGWQWRLCVSGLCRLWCLAFAGSGVWAFAGSSICKGCWPLTRFDSPWVCSMQGSVASSVIDAEGLIDTHYHTIATAAMINKPSDLTVSDSLFEGQVPTVCSDVILCHC